MGPVDLSKLRPAPPGFEFVQGVRGVILCPVGYGEPLEKAGFQVDARHAGETLPDAAESGKEPLAKLSLQVQRPEGSSEPETIDCLVRRFSHGGLARALTGRRFKDPARPFEELRLSLALRAASIPTPRVIAARAVRSSVSGFELALVTERLPSKVDLGRLIGHVRRGQAPRNHLRRALVQTARLIAALHAIGFRHSDLQPANLLVPANGGGSAKRGLESSGASVLDLDRSEFVSGAASPAPLPEAARLENLGRLWRHVRRREEKYGAVFTPKDLALFLRAYGFPKDQVQTVAAGIERAASKGSALHRAGWMFDALLGRGEDARA